jgi:hypothetical protein
VARVQSRPRRALREPADTDAMSAINWDREFSEPWRSLGKAFVEDLAALAAGQDLLPLTRDRRALRLCGMTREEIAEAAGVSLSFVNLFALGETPLSSPQSDRVRNVLFGELVK